VRLFCSITGHPQPEVFHTNEGHAGFLGIERIREYLADGASFAEAVELTRAGTVFTTHTPVPAGIDRFDKSLIEAQFGSDSGEGGLPLEQVLAFGAETYEGGSPDRFNMAVMGMRLAQRVNGVSALHGEVSREMFTGLWPGFDTSEVPIGSITNGVHGPTWVAPEVLSLAENGYKAGAAEWLADEAPAWEAVAADPARIFQIRQLLRARLVAHARSRLRASWQQRGASDAELSWIANALDENILTIGFARRVPSYKRLTLMLQDPERLTALLLDPERPVQIVIAGKAHPADDGGKALIQEMVRFADNPAVRHRIVFLPDYDMELARTMVQGCDVWLNNPLRPLEACGTSGMKSSLNGGLNVSVKDGWWDEWFDGDNGWAIPSAASVTDQERRDSVEASALYDLLGRSVAPLFYDRGPDGLQRRWLEMVTHTLRTLGPKAQATRMVRAYTTDLYLPAARSSRELTDGSGGHFAEAAKLSAWKQRVIKAWPGVRIEHVESHDGEQHPGAPLVVRAGVALGELSPDDVTVEVLSGRTGPDDEIADPVRTPLRLEALPGTQGSGSAGSGAVAWYSGEALLGQPGPFGYTVRVLPSHPQLSGPAEMGLVVVPIAPTGMINGDLR
jgi:starch phosphorylase